MDIKPVARDRSQLKIGVIGALAVMSGYLFGYFFYLILPGGPEGSTVLFFSVAALWLTILAFIPFLVSKNLLGTGMFLGSMIALFIGSRASVNVITVTGFVLAVAWMLSGYLRVRRDITNAMRIHFARTALRACQTFLTAVAFFGAFVFVSSIKANNSLIPVEAVRGTLAGAEPVVAALVPGFSLKSSVHDVVENMVRDRLGAGASDAVVEGTVESVLQNASESLNITIVEEALVEEVIYAGITEKIKTLSPSAQSAVLAGIGVLVFLIAKGIGVLFSYVAAAFAFLVYHGARAAGFIRIENVEARKEIIVL